MSCQDPSGSIFDEAVAPSGSGFVTAAGGDGVQEGLPKTPSFV